jgi:hypothetical protein
MPRIIFMNDRLVPEEEAKVSVFDHGHRNPVLDAGHRIERLKFYEDRGPAALRHPAEPDKGRTPDGSGNVIIYLHLQ